MEFLSVIFFLLTMLIGLIWKMYNFYLMCTVLAKLDAKNDELMVLRADSYFAKSGRSAIYMYASTFPGLFSKNRKKLKFFATERERLLYKINCYLGLVTAFLFFSAVFADWILDHQIYWW